MRGVKQYRTRTFRRGDGQTPPGADDDDAAVLVSSLSLTLTPTSFSALVTFALSLPAAIMWAPGMSSPSFAKISRSVFTTLFPVLPELPTTSTRPNFVDPVLAALASVALDASPFVRRFAPGIVSPLLFAVTSASGPPPFIELPVDVESPRSAETAIMVVVASVARHRTPRSRRISYRRFSASA